MTFTPRDPDFERRVRGSFARQKVMQTIGVTLDRIAPGEVELGLPFRADLTQQHGFLHAGIITTVVDSACGYAALSLMEAGAAVLSVEFKVNLLAPARGDRFRAIGRVVKSGKTLTVVQGELHTGAATSGDGGGEIVAVMTGTMMAVRGRPELAD